ncbi:MAG: penicillin-binding protein 1A [Hyphomicrobiales bacterium]
MRHILRFFGFLFSAGAILFALGSAVVGVVLWHYSQTLPDYTQLAAYEPSVTTRVHAGDGSLLAEYSRERRLYIPIQIMPKMVINAFISAEDKNFYRHVGIDPEGIVRAVVNNITSPGRRQGASTITQQVAKNFLLSNVQTVDRKIKEMLLALKIETAYSKDRILDLYLNEIYLGLGNYGVAAASLNYFGKSVDALTLSEIAYLAALPKAPNNYHPFRKTQAALDRRDYVIDRMVENGYVSRAEGEAAKQKTLGVQLRSAPAGLANAGFFAEEVRRELSDRYGEKTLYEGGLSVRTTLDPRLQSAARQTLADGLVRYDESRGFHGVVQKIDIASNDWGTALAEIPALNDVQPWRLATILDVSGDLARIGLQPGRDTSGRVVSDRETGVLGADGLKWTRKTAKQLLAAGDVVYVEAIVGKPGQFRLRQVPDVSGALVAMDPYTGRVLAMVGGFSFDQSKFNRATQALRQPGSAFKPFVYAAALDNGYTPSTLVLDAPIEINAGPGQEIWRPENFDKQSYGLRTLRYGIEHSKNQMTVRLAQDIGMPLVAEYSKRFGLYTDLLPVLAMSLGAGETTVLKVTSGYSMFVNGGRKITPTLIDRIQDRWGKTVYRHDARQCPDCESASWQGQAEPALVDPGAQVIDPLTAYQMTSILEGVVVRGTGASIAAVGKPLAGKTGTTNDAKDLWFVGFSPDLAVGVYLGYDKPKSLGSQAQAATYAAPIFRDFMKIALADKPATPFRVPAGIKLVLVNGETGGRAEKGEEGALIEAFKPGTGPADFRVVDGSAPNGLFLPSPETERAIGAGTGGIY